MHSQQDSSPNVHQAANTNEKWPTTKTALSTPHDAVLAELRGPQDDSPDILRSETRTPNNQRLVAPRLSVIPSVGTAEYSTHAPSETQGRRSAAASPMPGSTTERDAVYDPFTGALSGVIIPQSSSRGLEHVHTQGSPQLDQAKDDLWTHLSRIRELQSEVAGMHVQMEGIGLSDSALGATKRSPGATRGLPSETIDITDDLVDSEGPDRVESKAKDGDFKNLAESFSGRRVAIDGIMNKLDELSKALTTFHALPTPVMNFTNQASRSNTKDSQALSPIVPDATPPFGSPISSPTSPPLSPLSTSNKRISVIHTELSKPGAPQPNMSESPVSDDISSRQ